MPHARGDEPCCRNHNKPDMHVCPTHVGMNRNGGGSISCYVSMPHARGDEPQKRMEGIIDGRSMPHARGDEPFIGASSDTLKSSMPHARGDEPGAI